MLLATTRPGDLVLDPFLGAGTTAAVAKRLGRRFIGIERERAYLAAARARVAAVEPDAADALAVTPSKREAPRVPFGAVVERGLIGVGAVLTSARGEFPAKVRADGTLIHGEHRGSIHQVGAAVQNAPSCNGWAFWHAGEGAERRPIGYFRDLIRAEMAAGG